nr:MAG TPA: Gemin6 6 [Caudoviricetes sp.]
MFAKQNMLKKVSVTLDDGRTIDGVVYAFEGANDRDDGCESISILKSPSDHHVTDILNTEILSMKAAD